MHYGGSKIECMKDRVNYTPYMTLKSGREIPDNKELSVLDIEALKKYYAPPSKLYSNWYKLGEFTFKLRYLKFLNLQSFDKILDQ